MVTSAISRRAGREIRDTVVIRFAGDSGDGMQVTGSQFTLALVEANFTGRQRWLAHQGEVENEVQLVIRAEVRRVARG